MQGTYTHSRPRDRLRFAAVRPRSPAVLSDAELVAASGGDPDMFTELFHRHWDRLCRFCLNRAGPPGEDIAAEAFRVAYDSRSRYRAEYADAGPWLFGIATNLLRDHFRAVRREQRNLERSAAAEVVSLCDPEIDVLDRRYLAPGIAEALRSMPALDRDALLLLAWADLDYEQIALALDVPVGTVRSRIHRARQRLRHHLANLIPADTKDACDAH